MIGAGEISGRETRGLEPADASELGDVVAGRESPSMLAFRLRPLAGTEPRSLAVTVARYTPQAVLIANVEEARYRVLTSEDGQMLVHARYAIRNNQRSFLKVSLPGSLPYIVAGIRVALGRALVYIVVAEQYGAATGLGYLSSVAAQRFQMAAMFVPIIIIAGLGAGLTELLKSLERRLDKWKPQK